MIGHISNIEDLMTTEILSKAKKRTDELSPAEKEHWRQAISWFFLTDMIKTKIRAEIQQKMKYNDLGTFILSIILIICQFLQQLLYINFNKIIDKDKGIVTVYLTGKSSLSIELIRVITSCGSLILLGLISFHYSLKKYLLIFKQQYEINSSLKTTRLLIPFIFEILLSLIHTPPLLNNIVISFPTFESNMKCIPVDINIIITVLSQIRYYLLIKFYFNYSRWGNDRAARICKETNVSHDMIFVLKAELKDHPFILVPLILMFSFFVFGYILSSCEMCFIYDIPISFYQDWTNMFNGIWCICTSMMSLGYGDFHPRTIIGRILIMLSPIWGLTIISYFIISIISQSQMSSNEANAFKEMKYIKDEDSIKKQGLLMILSFYRLNRILNSDNSNKEKNIRNKQKEKRRKGIGLLRKAINSFKKTKRRVNQALNEITVEEMMGKINIQIKDTLNFIVYTSKTEVNNMLNCLEVSRELQKKIHSYVKILLLMTKRMVSELDIKEIGESKDESY